MVQNLRRARPSCSLEPVPAGVWSAPPPHPAAAPSRAQSPSNRKVQIKYQIKYLLFSQIHMYMTMTYFICAACS